MGYRGRERAAGSKGGEGLLLLPGMRVHRPGGHNVNALQSISGTAFLQDFLFVPGVRECLAGKDRKGCQGLLLSGLCGLPLGARGHSVEKLGAVRFSRPSLMCLLLCTTDKEFSPIWPCNLPGGHDGGSAACAAAAHHSRVSYRRPVLTISFLALPAGDLGDTLGAVRLALQLLRPKFKRVVFVPGNHDLCVGLIELVQLVTYSGLQYTVLSKLP